MGNPARSTTAEARFAWRLRRERTRLGWTQADVASRLAEQGIMLHPSAVAKMERRDVGRPRVIRLDEARAIARIFGRTLDDMLDSPGGHVHDLLADLLTWAEMLEADVVSGEAMLGRINEYAEMVEDPVERDTLIGVLRPDLLRKIILQMPEGEILTLASVLRHPSRAHLLDHGEDAAGAEHREEG